MTLPFLRRRRERHLAREGSFPDTGETITEILDRVRPASYDAQHQDGQIAAIRAAGYRAWNTRHAPQQASAQDTAPAWDGTTLGGASNIGLPGGAVYGPPPAPPEATP